MLCGLLHLCGGCLLGDRIPRQKWAPGPRVHWLPTLAMLKLHENGNFFLYDTYVLVLDSIKGCLDLATLLIHWNAIQCRDIQFR